MSQPYTMQALFRDAYDGFPAVRFTNSADATEFEAVLREKSVSYRTKIVKHKKRGREFVVMLVKGAPSGT